MVLRYCCFYLTLSTSNANFRDQPHSIFDFPSLTLTVILNLDNLELTIAMEQHKKEPSPSSTSHPVTVSQQEGVEAPPEEEIKYDHGEDIQLEPDALETEGFAQANGTASGMPPIDSLHLDDHALLRSMRLSNTQQVTSQQCSICQYTAKSCRKCLPLHA